MHFTRPLWQFVESEVGEDAPRDLSDLSGSWLEDWTTDKINTFDADHEDVIILQRIASNMTAADWNGMAADLRDVMHTADCDDREWQRYSSYDYV